MTEPTLPTPENSEAAEARLGCGFQLVGLLLIGGLLWLLQHLGWWPRERGWLTGAAYVGTAVLGGALTVALASLWDRVRRR